MAAGYASQNLGLKLRLANDREHLGRPHCTGGWLPQWSAQVWPISTLNCGFTPRSHVSYPGHETWGN